MKDNNRLLVVLLALIIVLLCFHGYVMKRQEEAVRKVDTSLMEIRQSLAEMRNKLPQMPGPGTVPGGATSQFPPGLGPQGDRGLEKGNGQHGKGQGGGHKGQGDGTGPGTGKGPAGSSAVVVQHGEHQRFTGSSPTPARQADPEGPAAPGPAGANAGSTMAQVLARLIVLEYRADMAMTDEQTAKIKQVLQGFKSHTVEAAAAEKQIMGLLAQKQRDYLKEEADQVKTKAHELSSISGKDDAAYADLALEFLDKPIRPAASATP